MVTNKRPGKRRGDELTEVITVRISPNVLAELQRMADAATVPVGTIARQAILRDLESQKKLAA